MNITVETAIAAPIERVSAVVTDVLVEFSCMRCRPLRRALCVFTHPDV